MALSSRRRSTTLLLCADSSAAYHGQELMGISQSVCNGWLGDVLAKSAKHCRHNLGQRRAIRFGGREKERTFFDLLRNELEVGCELKRGGYVAELDFVDLPVQERRAQSSQVTRSHRQERPIASDQDAARSTALGQVAPIFGNRWGDSFPKPSS
jgi:hypothetical protein